MSENGLVKQWDFPASQKMTYLNAASVALMYSQAAEAAIEWQKDLAENGTLNFDEEAEVRIFEDLRFAAAKLIEAKSSDIAVGSSATELLSSLAWATLPTKDEVIVGTEASFPSTIYPWQRVSRYVGCEVQLAKTDKLGFIDEGELLDLIDERTAIVAISHVEYKTGQVYDLEAISEKAHYHGGLLIVDATQSAGQFPINVQKMNADAIVASGYKWLCGPFGSAFLYLAPGLQNRLDPGIVGWRSHKDIWDLRADRVEYPNSAKRFEPSTMAYGSVIGLSKAIDFLTNIGIENIYSHNLSLIDVLVTELRSRGGNILLKDAVSRHSSILSVDFPMENSEEIVRLLNNENVIVSFREHVRISPHIYNNENDIGKLIEVFDTVTRKQAN